MKYKHFEALLKNHAHQPVEINRLEIDDILMSFIPQEKKQMRFFSRKNLAMMASSLMLLIVGALFTIWEFKPTKILTVDINPGFEINVNRFNRVVSINAVNEDAIPMIDDLSYWHKSPEKVLKNIYDVATLKGYTVNDSAMLISLDENDEVLVSRLSSEADELNIKTVFMSTNYSSVYVYSAKLESKTENVISSDSINFYAPVLESTASMGSNSDYYFDSMDTTDIINNQFWSETAIKEVAHNNQITIGKLQLVIAIFNAYEEYDTIEEFQSLIDSSISTLLTLYENKP